MSENKTIERKRSIGGISAKTDDKLTAFCKKNGLKKNEFVELSLEYFLQNSINPKTDEAPADELRKIEKRIEDIFAFLNFHEKKVLPGLMENYIKKKFLFEHYPVEITDYNETTKTEETHQIEISLFELLSRIYHNSRRD